MGKGRKRLPAVRRAHQTGRGGGVRRCQAPNVQGRHDYDEEHEAPLYDQGRESRPLERGIAALAVREELNAMGVDRATDEGRKRVRAGAVHVPVRRDRRGLP